MHVKDVAIHLIPVMIAIVIFEVLVMQIYIHVAPCDHCLMFIYWVIAQAAGGLILGHLSDIFCRKKFLIVTQIFGIVSIGLLFWQGFNTWILILLGLSFNPISISRAALVDNFPHHSKVKIISLTFIAQFFPWCFYVKLVEFQLINTLIVLFISLIVNLFFSYFFFEDRRDFFISSHSLINKKIFHKKTNKKVILTLVALLAAELVFFISDYSFKGEKVNDLLFSLLGIGCLFGVMLAIAYRKIPHLSFLTISYGMGLIIATMPAFAISILSFQNISLTYQVALLAPLGGLYLPFVYDVVLSSTSVNFRGTLCGILELVVAISSVVGLAINQIFNPEPLSVLYMSVGLFLLATFFQKKTEYGT